MSSRKRSRADDDDVKEEVEDDEMEKSIQPPPQKRRLTKKETTQIAKRAYEKGKAEAEAKKNSASAQAAASVVKVKSPPAAAKSTATFAIGSASSTGQSKTTPKSSKAAARAALAKQLLAKGKALQQQKTGVAGVVASPASSASKSSSTTSRTTPPRPAPSPKTDFQSPKPPPARKLGSPPIQQQQQQQPRVSQPFLPSPPQQQPFVFGGPVPAFGSVAPVLPPQYVQPPVAAAVLPPPPARAERPPVMDPPTNGQYRSPQHQQQRQQQGGRSPFVAIPPPPIRPPQQEQQQVQWQRRQVPVPPRPPPAVVVVPVVKHGKKVEVGRRAPQQHDDTSELGEEDEPLEEDVVVVVEEEDVVVEQEDDQHFPGNRWFKLLLGLVAFGLLSIVYSNYIEKIMMTTPLCFESSTLILPETASTEDEEQHVVVVDLPAHCPIDPLLHEPCPPHAVCKGGSIVSCDESRLWLPGSYRNVMLSNDSNEVTSLATRCVLSEDAEVLVSAVLRILEGWSLPRMCYFGTRPASSKTVESSEMPLYTYDLMVEELNKPQWAQKRMEKGIDPAEVDSALFQDLAEGRLFTTALIDDDDNNNSTTLWVGLLPGHKVPFPLDCLIGLGIVTVASSSAKFLFKSFLRFVVGPIMFVMNIGTTIFRASPLTTAIVVILGTPVWRYLAKRKKNNRLKRQLDADCASAHRLSLDILKNEKGPLGCLALRDDIRQELRKQQGGGGGISSNSKTRFNQVVWPNVQSRLERDQRIQMLLIRNEPAMEWVGPRTTKKE